MRRPPPARSRAPSPIRSGAVMPGVKVVVTSQQTGLTRETTTSDVGSYVVPLLPVGNYLVTAEQ